MADYRDYGALSGGSAPLVPVDTVRKTQVYTATHDGNDRLSYMNRSFISFSYDGKWIEDFNLLAIIENNAMQRKIYADFEDNVSDSEVWDGQLYWSTHYKANEMTITLFTDGITEVQLDDFKHHFSAGKIGELVLAEHPNRGILARISEAPEYSVLPFEEKTTVKVAGQDYETSTTTYKGKITLNFVIDDPFWYSRASLLDSLDGSNNTGFDRFWTDANGRKVHALDSKDALKIILEDRVPVTQMLYELDDNYVQQINNLTLTRTDEAYTDQSNLPLQILLGDENAQVIYSAQDAIGSFVDSAQAGFGHVAYFLANSTGITINENQPGYFFYGGTAPCAPILTFSVTPQFSSSSANNGYIAFPRNSYTNPKEPYNKIFVQCEETQEFRFTTPGIITGYNQAISLIKQAKVNSAWEDLKQEIRTNVKHWAPRQYAILIINQTAGNSLTVTNSLKNSCINNMKNFFILDENNKISTQLTCVIDCKTGVSLGTFICRNPDDPSTTISVMENVGDMIRSDYLIIKERNQFVNGYIRQWSSSNKISSHRIYSNITLNNVSLKFKNLYL